MKDKNSAGLLAFFLGGLGIHRFYLRQTGLGFLYLLFCWTFIPAIVAIIDAIIFWTMDSQKFNSKYNRGEAPVIKNFRIGVPDWFLITYSFIIMSKF